MKKEDLQPIQRPNRIKYGKEYIGKTFNRWKVKEIAGTPKNENNSCVYWRCECLECGKNYYKRSYRVVDTTTNKTCQHCRPPVQPKGPDNKQWTGGEFISGWFFNHYKRGVKSRDLEFNITVEDAEEKLKEQDFKCAYTGVPIETTIDRNDYFTASIDRIDNNKGYTKDNIQWVHKIINKMKGDMTEQEFLNWCKKVVN